MVKGFMQMWHTMSECHKMHCHVLSHAKYTDSTMAVARFNEDDIDLIEHLEVQLLDLTTNLARWSSWMIVGLIYQSSRHLG
ncbi:unnamed protein product [Urochloa humidicola]